nr:MAG TPA: hypothetical protein [Caudoviricetes sp.]
MVGAFLLQTRREHRYVNHHRPVPPVRRFLDARSFLRRRDAQS